LALADGTQGPGEELLATKATIDHWLLGEGHFFGSVRKSPDGATEFRVVGLTADTWSRRNGVVIVELQPGQRADLHLGSVPLGAWNDSVRKQLERDLR
jgi:hypothetical protein